MPHVYTVTLYDLGTHGVHTSTRSATVFATDAAQARATAIRRWFGRRCFWLAENTLGRYDGHVREALRPTLALAAPGTTPRTGRAWLTITEA